MQNWFFERTRKLTFKISFLVFILIMLAFAIFALVFLDSEKKKLSVDILHDEMLFAEFASPNIYGYYQDYYVQDRPDMFALWKDNMEMILAKNTDITKVQLLGTSGKILFDTSELEGGRDSGSEPRHITDPVTLKRLEMTDQTYRLFEDEKGEGIEIIVPLIEQTGGHISSLRYEGRYDSLHERMKQIYRQTIMTLIPIVIITLLLAIPFAHRMTRPIPTLTRAVKKLSEGNYDPLAESKIDAKITGRQDEIGELCMEFKNMIEVLKMSKESLEKHSKDIEEKYKIKTKELQEKNDQLEKFNKIAIGRELKIVEMKKKVAELEARLNGTKPGSVKKAIAKIKKDAGPK